MLHSEKNISFLYTVTEFNKVRNDSQKKDHISGLQGKHSTIYQLNFQDRENFSREEIKVSNEKIVYHDFCKDRDNHIYAVSGQFGEEYGYAKIEKVFPKEEQEIIFESDEIRFRDCEILEGKNKNIIGFISHGKGKAFLINTHTRKIQEEYTTPYNEDYDDITFIHEFVGADLDHDGKKEYYFTPSEKNVGETQVQRGRIARLVEIDEKWILQDFDDLGDFHAKELHVVHIDGQDILLISRQGRYSGDATKLLVPTKIQSYHYDDNSVLQKNILAEVPEASCRTIEDGNIFSEGLTIAIGCKKGTLQLFEMTGKDTLSLKTEIENFKTLPHSMYFFDTNDDGIDEIFLGINQNGLYHYDPVSSNKKLFQLYDYSDSNSWFWSMIGMY